MKDIKENYSPVYGCVAFCNKYKDDDVKAIDYEVISSISKSLNINKLKLLHKHIINIADELYRFSVDLSTHDKEEYSCKISIETIIKELNNVTEFLTKWTLGGIDEASK